MSQSKTQTDEELIKHLNSLSNLRQDEAAEIFGISKTGFKQICRKVGLKRWPYKRPTVGKPPKKNNVPDLTKVDHLRSVTLKRGELTLTMNDLEPFFDTPIEEVANYFGTSSVTIRKAFKILGGSRWPFRALCGLAASNANKKKKKQIEVKEEDPADWVDMFLNEGMMEDNNDAYLIIKPDAGEG